MTAEVLAGRRQQRTLDYYRHELRAFVNAHGGRLVADLVPYDLVELPRTWHKVQAVQRLFSWGSEVELIDRNPFRRVERPPLGQRHRVLTRAELARLIRSSARPLRRLLVSARHTLARPGELRGLRWDWLRPEIPAFVLHHFKARNRRRDAHAVRLLLLDPYMVRMVRRWQARAYGPWVLLDGRAHPWSTNGVRCAVRRARRRAGMVGGGEQVVAYTLRHTAATWATVAGVRDRALADLLGHTTTRTTARYQHLEAGHLAEAIRQATGR